ncbi:MAG: nucleotidyltransferase family protein [Asticcacaulis sp.]|uniref:nucleotidyltransferase family protein n=1 Tax=Asticcacaulis sp. TaxID=1872648 RepID=UPI003F7B9884
MQTALIVLAAGQGRRFGGNKLLARLNGRPLARYTAACAGSFPFIETIAVTSQADDELAEIFLARGFKTFANTAPEAGLGLSLRLGLEATTAEAVFVLLADMPCVPAAIFPALSQKLTDDDLDAVRPLYKGQPGHPALLRRRCFHALQGEAGAATLFHDDRFRTGFIDSDDKGVIEDVDTLADLARLQQFNDATKADY